MGRRPNLLSGRRAAVSARAGGLLMTGAIFSLFVSGTSWAPPPPLPPGPPTSVVVRPGNQQAVVTWQGNYAGWGYFPDGYEAKTKHAAADQSVSPVTCSPRPAP